MTSHRTPTIRILVASVLLIAVLGFLAGSAIAQNPVPFLNQPLVPDATAPGGAGFTLTVNGTGFVAGSTVKWNGSPRATTFVSRSQLTAAILASDISSPSTATVTVVSPSPGGGVSNIQFFSIAVAETSASFQPAVTYDSGGYIAQSVKIADLKGDGKLDIVVANWWGANNIGNVGVLIGNGDGTFQPAVNYETGGAPNYSLVVADVNGDGKLDLIVSSCSATASTCGSAEGVVSVLLGNGNGTFQPALSFGSGASVGAQVAVADVNGDGKLDLIVTNFQGEANGDGTAAVLLGNGDGTFQSPVLYDSGVPGANVVAVADVNGDGVLDLLVADGCFEYCSGDGAVTRLSVLLGNGDGTFQPAVTYATGGSRSGWVSVADVNGDGKPDAVLGNSNVYFPNGTVGILLGVGNGTFEAPVTYDSGGYAAVQLALADVTADGHLDIIVDNCGPVGSCGTGLIGELLGRGDGTFDPVVTFSSGVYNATAIAVADLNGDGRLDLVAANQCAADGCATGSVSVLLNSTASLCVGKCATSTTISSSSNPSVHEQPITFTATVTSAGGTPPNGETVTFYNGLNVIGTAPMTGGIASLTTPTLQSGIFTISAAYLGDASFTASTSPALHQAVDTSSQSPTTTALTSSLNPSLYGQKVTWTATVKTSGSTIPTGKVNFNWSGYSIGTAMLNSSGVATLTRSLLSADAYPLFAVYTGDTNNGPSASPILNQVITQTTSAATITASPNPSTQGEAVTFTAKISSPTATPAGPVTFTAGKTVLGSVELSDGKATFTTSTLAVGSTKVTVTYPRDSNISSSSASVTQVVQQ
jgi:large repetitive protein